MHVIYFFRVFLIHLIKYQGLFLPLSYFLSNLSFSEIREIAHFMQAEVKKKFPEIQRSGGIFIFLRLFSPAILAPELYGGPFESIIIQERKEQEGEEKIGEIAYTNSNNKKK